MRTPWHLWAVGIVAVLFNAIGVFDFGMTRLQGEAYMARAGMTPAQIAVYRVLPAWMIVAWAVGVFAAFGASLLLLARRRSAVPAFVIALAAFLVSQAYTYGFIDGERALGMQMAVTSVVIALLLALFAWYARAMAVRGVLR